MVQRFKKTWSLIQYNWKTLFLFETFYRLLGLAIIFPLTNHLLYLSVQLTGNEFITNANFISYITSPTTILLIISLILIFSIYIAYDIIVLSLLFHSSHFKQKIDTQTLVLLSFTRIGPTLKKYNLTIFLSSLIFLFLVEGLHIVGIASTIQVPELIESQIRNQTWILPVFFLFIIILTILFIETIFYEIECTVRQKPIRKSFKRARSILKGKRLKILEQFLLLNGLLNLLLYLLYIIIILLVGLGLLVFSNVEAVYPYMLTIFYSLYLFVGFIATITLIPFNFAWINSLYYEHYSEPNKRLVKKIHKLRVFKPIKNSIFQSIIFTTTLLVTIAIVLSFSIIFENPARLELFNNPSIVSHRGGGFLGPENTLSGIEIGLDNGADAIEIDIRFTKDGVPVLMHDETLGRTTNDSQNRRVSRLTYEELLLLDAGSWFSDDYIGEHIPTLEEALNAINGRAEVFIELKADFPDMANIIVGAIENTNSADNVKILSFKPYLLLQIKNLNPEIETILLLSNFIGDVNVLGNSTYIDHFGFNYYVALSDKEYVRRLQESGKGVYVWTINTESAIIEANNLGVDGITTDYPLFAREIVYRDLTKPIYQKLLEIIFTRD